MKDSGSHRASVILPIKKRGKNQATLTNYCCHENLPNPTLGKTLKSSLDKAPKSRVGKPPKKTLGKIPNLALGT
jgi:hypothetical protein